MVPGFVEKMEAVRRLYDSTGGFVVVAPHLGNWEILLHVAEVVGIPTTTVVRPLDNPWLERLIYRYRTKHQQELVPKRNALMHLRRALRRGQCVAVMGDQRAGKRGIMAPFFGRPVATHRTAAILAREFNRPIMVLAGCRTATGFEGLMSDPIWPDLNAPEEQEILRLTTLVNRQMEEFIRRYPEQYLWAHDRWRDAAPEPVPTSPA
jgi:KDO2-lipid IV(A) lauroyltransferase